MWSLTFKFWRAPIRWKIVGLIVSALTFSLVSYSLVGTSMVIHDKTSYIYDQNVGRVSLAASEVRSWLEHLQLSGRLMISASSSEGSAESRAARLEPIYRAQAEKLNITGALLLVRRDDGELETREKLGTDTETIFQKIKNFGWNAASFERERALLGSDNGRLIIGLAALDRDGQPVFFVASAKLSERLLGADAANKDSRIELWDTIAGVALLRSGNTENSDLPQATELVKSIGASLSNFATGAREAKMGDQDYVVGYEGGAKRLGFSRLVLVGMTPKSVAFESARSLTERTAILGISVLLISIGAALLLIRRLVLRLKALVNATIKVGSGDFSQRVEVEKNNRDELNSLAQSFNVMADEIDKLMAATAQKARMQEELKTAQTVQNRFFPEQRLAHPNFSLAGRVVPASECGGDWWFYEQDGDYLVVLCGDVTGHGVSAALVTAAAHGAFATFRREMRRDAKKPDLKAMIEALNFAVYSAAGNEATMTLVASVIDLKTGAMELVNASHRTPYLVRLNGTASANATKNLKPLTDGKCPALGSAPTIECAPATHRLRAGDLILWYTDGVLECTNSAGKPMSRADLANVMTHYVETGIEDASSVCDGFMELSLEFFGEKPNGLEDDVTVVVGIVPKNVLFAEVSDSNEVAA